MRAKFAHLLWLKCVLFTVVSGLASAHDFGYPEADRLAEKVATALTQVKKGEPAPLDEIGRLFSSLDRGKLDGESLLELKYLMTQFRVSVAAARVEQAKTAPIESLARIVEELDHLGAFITADQARVLLAKVKSESELGKKILVLLAKYGDPRAMRKIPAISHYEVSKSLLGPAKLPLFDGASYVDEFGNDLWVGKPEFELSNYQATGKYSAIVRGVSVRSGDVYVLDQGVTGGINTNFSVPRSYASHMGLVVFLEKNEKIYPAFFEIAERGLRVLPLHSAFAPPFTYYGEIYRPVGVPVDFDGWARKLSVVVQEELKKRYWYDYYVPKINSGNEKGLVCSTQVELFLQRLGIKFDLVPDKTDETARKSLKAQFDFVLDEYVTPTSFLRAGKEKLSYVGHVESDLARINLAREIVIGSAGDVSPESLGYLFSHYELDLQRIEGESRATFEQVNVLFPAAVLLGKVNAKAPPKVIPFVKALEPALTKTIQSVERDFTKLVHEQQSGVPFSLHETSVKKAMVDSLRELMTTPRSWFVTQP